MRKFLIIALVVSVLVVLSLPAVLQAQRGDQTFGLVVAESAICKNVVDRKPMDSGSSFPSTVGKLYCFTQIDGAPSPTSVTHVWYYGTKESAKVKLLVGSSAWPTWSSTIIQPNEIGSWHVEVLDVMGNK